MNIVVRCLVFFFVFIPSIVCAEIFIPEDIKPPFAAKSVLTVSAKGDQIYLCSLKNTIYSWQLQAPDAQLFDMNGKLTGYIFNGKMFKGNNKVQFNIGHLSPGNYVIKVSSGNENLFSKTIIKYYS